MQHFTRLTGTAALALAAVLFTPVAYSDDAAPQDDRTQASPVAEQDSVLPGRRNSGRLRFRDGPVCMCPDGLRERDIQAGELRHQARSQDDKKGDS